MKIITNTKENILVSVNSFESRIAIIEQGIIQELHIERKKENSFVGNIYLGKVIRILPGMQCAFIDIGLEKSAFIHVDDLIENGNIKFNNTSKSIEKLIYEGQILKVQVIKDQLNNKGARVSAKISIVGRMIVYFPYNKDKHIGISQKIASEEERIKLKNILEKTAINNMTGSFIIRTQAEISTEEEIKTDIKYLSNLWNDIKLISKNKRNPALLYKDLNLIQRVMRDIVSINTNYIYVDSEDIVYEMKNWACRYTPSIENKIKLYNGGKPLFDIYDIDEAIDLAISRRVNLKSGGYIIIDQTEALVTIDVNTGSFIGKKNFNDTIFKTNLEATKEILRQLRLRNLGGIIIIDFIDMLEDTHKNIILEELKKHSSQDRTKITVNGFSSLGLVEMTRKRTRESLINQLCEPCHICNKRGILKTAKTVCYEILREILRESYQFNPSEFRILASQIIIDMFLEEESYHLAFLSDLINKKISLEVEKNYNQEQYDIILI